jgi:hypothetical protein
MLVVDLALIVEGEKVGLGLEEEPSGMLAFLGLPVTVYGSTGGRIMFASLASFWYKV